MPLAKQARYRFTPPAQHRVADLLRVGKGLNTRDPELSTDFEGLTKAQNVRYLSSTAVQKRKGQLQKGNQIGTSTKILGLHSYVKKNLVAYLLAGFGTDIYKYNDAATPITITTTTNAQGVGYSKDRHVFVTTANLDANSAPYVVVISQTGSDLVLEWEDSPYNSWGNTPIVIDASTTQIGFSGYMDSSDNIHVAFMTDANTVKYVKLTYAAGPTWTVGTAVTVKGSGASDSASFPTITRQSGGRIHVAFRYYDGTNYQVRAMYSDDAGVTWTGNTGLSTASTNTRHFPALTLLNDQPVCVYQVGAASTTSFFYQIWNIAWSGVTTIDTVTSSTDAVFSTTVTGTTVYTTYATVTGSSGLTSSAFGSLSGAQRRNFTVVNDGANDNDIQYKNVINGSEDGVATRVSDDANNNLYPTSPEYVLASATFVPVVWIEGTVSPYNIKINAFNRWTALSASLTTNKRQSSVYFAATDSIYITNATDVVKFWDGTTLSSANASYPKPKCIFTMDNRLWSVNYASTQNRAGYSAIGADSTGGALPSGNYIDFPEQLEWGHHYRGSIGLFFTRNDVYVVSNYNYSGTAAGPEVIVKIPNSYGTLSGWTVKQVGYWVYYQRPDGHIMRTNGQYAEICSDVIRATIADLALGSLADAAAGTLGNYYYVSVTGNAAGKNNTWLVLDTTMAPSGGWSLDTGKNTSCFVTHPDTSGSPQLFVGESTTTNGTVYQAEISDSDAGSAITMDVRTGLMTFGEVFRRKLLRQLFTIAEASGNYNLTLGYATGTNANVFFDIPVSLNPGAPVWGTFIWGAFTWGGASHIESNLTVNVRDRFFRLRLYNSGANQPVKVLSLKGIYEIIKDEL